MLRIRPLLALAALWACGGEGGSSVTQPSEPQPNTVSIVNGAATRGSGAFSPNPLTVTLASGGSVTWRNDDRQAAGGEYGGTDGTDHDMTSDDLTFSSGIMAPGATYHYTFDAAGTYGYHCSIHPSMIGTVTVTP